jgi:hypothetical protein
VNPVPGVRITASSNAPNFDVVAMNAPNVTCQPDGANMRCDLGNLPANASVPVTVRYRALRENSISSATVSVSTARDSNPSNNVVDVSGHTFDVTDLRLAVAQTSVSGRNGETLQFPRITITNGTSFAGNVVVEIPLPAFTTVQSVSSSVTCTGTSTLLCDFQLMVPNESASIDLTLATSGSGGFSSNVAVRSLNDSTGGNNAASVNITVSALPQAGGSSSGGSSGGGGGGRIEWMLLALLGGIATRRAVRVRRAT